VVGVIANLAVYFATHTLFDGLHRLSWGPVRPEVADPTTLRPLAVVIGLVAAVMLFKLRWSVLRTLGVCALLGIAAALVGLPLT
jgi:chromate transporter